MSGVSINSSTFLPTAGVDRAIANLAARQHGLITTSQLRELGLSDNAVKYRVRIGRLFPLHRGVFSVGVPAAGAGALFHGAVLACGEGAVLSCVSLAAWMNLRESWARDIHVTCPREVVRRPGLRPHQSVLDEDERDAWNGIPSTTVSRLLIDLCHDGMRVQALTKIIEEIDRRELLDIPAVNDLIARRPGRRTKALKQILASPPSKDEMRRRFRRLVKQAQLPRGEEEQEVFEYFADFLWRDARLIVELDGYEWHTGRRRFEHDRARDARLQAAGWRVLRFTWRQITQDPAFVISVLRAFL